MHIRSKIVTCLVFFAILSMVAGCAKLPQQEIDQAHAAVEAAKTAQADKYVPADFNALLDAYNTALTDIEKQKTASPFSRKYDDAKSSLLAVVSMANNITTKVGEEKAKIAAQVDSVYILTDTSRVQAHELLAQLSSVAHDAANLESLNSALSAVDTELVQAQAQKNSGDATIALERITVSNTKLDSLKLVLTAAIEKASRPAPKPVKKPTNKQVNPAEKKKGKRIS
jgi:hypothetical protein